MIATLTFKKKDHWSGRQVYENCRHAISCYIMRSGVRYTGLNGEENNPTRERLERELGVDLAPQSSYWDTFAVFLSENDVTIDTTVPEQELKFYFLKNHKRVAFGLNDRKPSTEYVLLQAEEEAKEQNTKARMKRRAILEFSRLSTEDMKKALRLFGYNSATISGEVAENTLFKLVEENPMKFLQIWVDNSTKNTHFLVEEAVAKGVLRKQQTTYKYGSDVLGYNLEQAIDHLDSPANADLKATILAQLEGKDVSFGDTKAEGGESTSQFTKLKREIEQAQKEEQGDIEAEEAPVEIPKKKTQTKKAK